MSISTSSPYAGVGTPPLISASRVALTRPVAYRFALDPTRAQRDLFARYAGAARYAFNHHLARVRANLDQRTAELSYGVAEADLTPSLSWSKIACINAFNQFKNGTSPSSPLDPRTGIRGLPWRGEVNANVFECASVDAAQALGNATASRKGIRAGGRVGFPRFKSRHKTTPSFRLRSRAAPGATAPIRVAGPKSVRLPRIGVVRIHGSTRRVARMLTAGRLHLYSATIRCEQGRWWVSLQGVAAAFHHQRRSPKNRHRVDAGMDLGIRSLAVIADTHTTRDQDVLHVVEAVKPLQRAQQQLRRAAKTLSRTKTGSTGRATAKARLSRVHARVANLRKETAHQLTYWCATQLTRLTVEDLNITGMLRLHSLAKALTDAGMGQIDRQLQYKADWYGLDLIQADRWFPSSKTCSGCGHIKPTLGLGERTYRCGHRPDPGSENPAPGCGLVMDRDINAAVNLARWPTRTTTSHPADLRANPPPAATVPAPGTAPQHQPVTMMI